MNVETEKRIVAMYFDNKDFETNAKQTIQTLGELKDNLNLEDSVKGFEELNNAGKQLNLTSAKNTVDNLKNSLSGMSGLISKAFTIGTGPIRALENFYNNVKSYATKIIGFDIANKVTGNLESALQQLTVAPIEAGWNMYQANIDSTKTIMSGTLQSYKKAMSETSADWTYNEEDHMAYVEKNLQELSDYAQKTVFSLSDMTNNVGKFTNNNIDLETSVTAMEGIANMTAKAGQGAAQASSAMYNFSQALGVGKMTSIDWKSIENANIATTELKDLFIQTAAASGKLQKELEKDANGNEIEKFYLTTKNGAALAKDNWIEITAENFRDTLSNGWLDKDTMLNVMQIYSGAINDLDTLAAMGFDTSDSELMEYLFSIGEEASKAASEVRTFSKMWDAMTESVQSGWSDSMKLIFGNLDEATEFWTEINKKLSSVLDSGANERNAILNEWRGRVYNEKTAEWEQIEGATDGREDLIQGIYGTIDALKAVGSAIKSAWTEVFGAIDGKKLQEITANFRSLVDQFKEWLGDINDTDSRISKIKTGLKGVFSVIKIITTSIRTFFNFVISVVRPFIDPILDLFSGFGDIFTIENAGNLGDILTTLGDSFSSLWDKLTGLGWSGVFSKIGVLIGELWEKVKTSVGQFLDDNGLSGVKEWLIMVGDKIQEGYEAVKEWWEGSGIPEFFNGIFDSITSIFKGKTFEDYLPDNYEGNVDLSMRPKVDMKIVTEAGWVDENGNPFEEGYATVLTNTFSVGKKSEGFDFEYNENAVINITPILPDGKVLSPEELENYLYDLTVASRRTGKSLKQLDAEKYGLMLSYDIVPEGMTLDEAYEQAGEWAIHLHELQEEWDNSGRTESEAPIVTFFKGAWESIKGFFAEAQAWWNDSEIPEFFTGIWDTVVGLFTPKDQYDDRGFKLNEQKSPIVSFFESTWESIKSFFETVKGWEIWKTIGGFFSETWATIVGVFTADELTGEAPIVTFFKSTWQSIEDFFESLPENEVIKAVGTFFSDLWDDVVGIFTPKDQYDDRGFKLNNQEAPIVTFFRTTWESIVEFFKTLPENPIVQQVGSFFTGIWDSVVGLFTPKDQYDDRGFKLNTQEIPIVTFFRTTWESIRDFFEEMKEWPIWKTLDGFFKDIWGTITGLFTGQSNEEKAAEDAIQSSGTGEETAEAAEEKIGIFERIFQSLSTFVQTIGEKLQGVDLGPVGKLLESLGTFLTGVMDAVSTILSTVGHFLSGGWDNMTGEEQKMVGIAGGVAAVITVLNIIMNAVTKKGTTFASQLKDFAVAMLALSVALGILTMIDTGKMWSGVGALAVLMLVLSGLIVSLTDKTKATKTPETATERVLTTLINNLTKLGMLWVVMDLLPPVIEAFGKAKEMAPELTGMDFLELFGGIVSLVVGISTGLALVNKLTGGQGLKIGPALETAVSIVTVANVLIAGLSMIPNALALGSSISDKVQGVAPGESAKATNKYLKDAGETFGLLGEGINLFVTNLLGIKTDEDKINEAGDILETMAWRSELFDDATMGRILQLMNAITNLTSMVDKVPDASKISSFAEALKPLGKGIIDFGLAVNGLAYAGSENGTSVGDLEEGIRKATDLIRVFDIPQMESSFGGEVSTAQDFVTNLDKLTELMTPERFEKYTQLVMGFAEAFDKATAPDGTAMVTTVQDLMNNLSASIKLGLEDKTYFGAFDATPVVDAIVVALGYGESAIATAVHAMVQAGIDAQGKGENQYEMPQDVGWVMSLLGDTNGTVNVTDSFGQITDYVYGKGGSPENPQEGSLFSMLGGIQDQMGQFEFPNLGEKLSSSISFKNEDGTDMDLLATIQENLTKYEESLSDAGSSFEIKLIPTFDWSNLSREALMQEIGDRPIDLPMDFNIPDAVKLDFAGMAESIDLGSVNARLDATITSIVMMRSAVVSAISSMDNHLDRVSTAIKNIKIYIDKDSLVGSITPDVDSALGSRSNTSSRTGVTSPLPNLYRSTKEVLSAI